MDQDCDEEFPCSCSLIEDVRLIEKGDPRTAKEALSTSEAYEWRKAMQSEYHGLMKNRTWTLVDRPKNRKVIRSRWVLRTN